MAEERELSRFDVTLTEDIVRDVATAGRTFKKEIWEQGTGKQALLGCIFLDKSDQDVVKLRVRVFHNDRDAVAEGSSSADQAIESARPAPVETNTSESQTEVAAETSTSGAQTTNETSTIESQTEVPTTSEAQTESAKATTSESQTELAAASTAEAQTEHSGELRTTADVSDSASQAVQPVDENFMQTDVAKLENVQSQTEKAPGAEKTSQTSTETADRTMQTDHKSTTQTASQTEKPPAQKTVKLQTSPPPAVELSVQTDPPSLSDGIMQTDEPDIVDALMQTQPEGGVGIASQTMEKPVTHHGMQTIIKHFSEISTQVECEVADSEVQPPINDVCFTDCFTVATVSTKDQNAQIQPQVVIHGTQTIIKTFADAGHQINPEHRDQPMQTSREFLCEAETVTDEVIIIDPEEQCENDCQTDALIMVDPNDQREIAIQTDDCKVIYPQNMGYVELQTDFVRVIHPELELEAGMQTEEVHIRDPEAQVENLTQTDDVRVSELVTLCEQEAQTTLVWVTGLQQSEEETPAAPEPAATEPAAAAPPTLEEQPPPLEAPVLEPEAPPPNVEAQKPGVVTVIEDKFVQTDPVTIIIGDSSFLVDRLKDYASGSPPKRKTPARTPAVTPQSMRMKRIKQEQGPPELTPAIATPNTSMENANFEQQEMPVLAAEGTPQRSYKPRNPVKKMKLEGADGSPSTYTSLRPKPLGASDLKAENVKGRFNCPYCPETFTESVELYKHLAAHHNLPKAINRRARRRGTIIITDDGQQVVENGGPSRKAGPKRRYVRKVERTEDEPDEDQTQYVVQQVEEGPIEGQEGQLEEGEEEGEEIEVLIEFAEEGETIEEGGTQQVIYTTDVDMDQQHLQGNIIAATTESGETVYIQQEPQEVVTETVQHVMEEQQVVYQQQVLENPQVETRQEPELPVLDPQTPPPQLSPAVPPVQQTQIVITQASPIVTATTHVAQAGTVVTTTAAVHPPPPVLEEQQVTVEVVQQEPVENGDDMPIIEAPPVSKRAFTCPLCPKTFPKSSALYVHLQNSHKAERSASPRAPKASPKTQTPKVVQQAQSQPQPPPPPVVNTPPEKVLRQTKSDKSESDGEVESAGKSDDEGRKRGRPATKRKHDEEEEPTSPAPRGTRAGKKAAESESPPKRGLRSTSDTPEVQKRQTRGTVLKSASPPAKRGRKK